MLQFVGGKWIKALLPVDSGITPVSSSIEGTRHPSRLVTMLCPENQRKYTALKACHNLHLPSHFRSVEALGAKATFTDWALQKKRLHDPQLQAHLTVQKRHGCMPYSASVKFLWPAY